MEPLLTFLEKLPSEPTKKVTAGQLNSMKLASLDVLANSGKVDSARIKTALLAMLNSCASNVCVVNIDNGFGGGYVASAVNRL